MTNLFAASLFLVALPLGLVVYAFALYPIVLQIIRLLRQRPRVLSTPVDWPMITIVVACYNGEQVLRGTLENIVNIDYPADRRQILVVSDGSTDATSAIAGEFESRGVEVLALTHRRGKAGAENAARPFVRGEIIVNTDASVRVWPDAVKALVRAFNDATVGVASGRDISINAGRVSSKATGGEATYVGYEMWVRSLETQVGSLVGASGCLYAMRRDLYSDWIADDHSHRDFASAIVARLHGLRAVSVPEAVCAVPRTLTLHAEYRRKVRTMAMGLQTLWLYRGTMNPWHHGQFAFQLISHKLCRWLVFPFLVPAIPALWVVGTVSSTVWDWLVLTVAAIALGAVGLTLALRTSAPIVVCLPAYLLCSLTAGIAAWVMFVRGRVTPTWEPTRRSV